MLTDALYDQHLVPILRKRESLTRTRVFSATSPLEYRYVNDELTPFLSEAAKFVYWGVVEGSATLCLWERKLVSATHAVMIVEAAQEVTPEIVYLYEYGDKKTGVKGLRHDVRAYLKMLCEYLQAEAHPFTHAFQTSYDKIDTANAARLRDSILEVIIPMLKRVIKKLIRLARKYARAVQVGRTHLQHASPVTFGFALAEYIERLGQQVLELERCAHALVGKFSGPVGTCAPSTLAVKDPRKLERQVLSKMHLRPSPYSTQIVIPEYAIDVYHTVTKIAGIFGNLADDMRHLQSTEIAEIKEPSGDEEGSSSVMPQKVNPITWENMKSVFKEILGRMVTRYLDLISEHQRELTNSASGRFAFEMVDLLLIIIKGADRILDKVSVDKTRMLQNLGLTRDQIAAEPLNTILRWHGHPDAHEAAGRLAKQARAQDCTIYELLLADRDLACFVAEMSERQHAILRDPKRYVGDAPKTAFRIARRWERRLQLAA